MTTTDISPKQALKKFFGFNTFKGLQEEVIKALLDKNDTFVIMPTGGGKSLCYQLPALMQEGVAIVVSPLIALMKNQVDALRGFCEDDSVAHFMNSSLRKAEIVQVKEDVVNGKTKLLYVAPESLTKDETVAFLQGVKISFVAIDEAHCISEWGHDFRPEYRRLKTIVREIADVPIIALTATATPKVQSDIQKNLGMVNASVFKASFNRPNLYYEVRPKRDVGTQIIKYVKNNLGKSGIIYCLSRKKVEEVAEMLQVNGISALAYHAGMDSKHRSSVQDQFLMQDVDVIVATIAFGMGIDKPDVRFVIHHDIPKSLESYYQETGRAGRDDGEGNCIAFYSYKDIEKLEKFLQGKPIAEQEVGMQLLQEVVGYCETSMSRRKYILHYFGEEFDEVNGPGAMNDDNMRYPKEQFEGKDQVQLFLKAVLEFKQSHKANFLCMLLTGQENTEVKTYRGDKSELYGTGKEFDMKFWNAVSRQCVVQGYLKKEIETYGTLKITELGFSFIESPKSFMLIKEMNFEDVDNAASSKKRGSGATDQALYDMLLDQRKRISKANDLPPYVIFSNPSLEEMASQYPITLDELTRIGGVGKGKAKKFGETMVELIANYVEDNEIDRPMEMLVKSVVKKSGLKVHIIQNIDRKLPLEDIARAKGKSLEDIIHEIESIVRSGTKVNIDYYIYDILDQDCVDELFEYFSDAETDEISVAYEEFDGDYTEEEIQLLRIKFFSDIAN